MKVRALKRAQILLKADSGPDGPAWSDSVIADALESFQVRWPISAADMLNAA